MSGAYFSEIYYQGTTAHDFIEVAVPTGTDVSSWSVAFYKEDGTVNSTFTLGSYASTTMGRDVYVIDRNTDPGFGNIGATKGYALVDDTGTVRQFISFSSAIMAVDGPAAGMSADQMGDLSGSGESMETTDGGLTYQAQATPNSGTIACFAAGTRIETPSGPVPVEHLSLGDRVLTAEGEPIPIVHRRRQFVEVWRDPRRLAPVLIKAGTFAEGLPNRDLVLSPHHRVMVGGQGAQLPGIAPSPCLAPAKALTALPGIRRMFGKRVIQWFHFATQSHAIVTANGCATESLLLSPSCLAAVGRLQRHALIERLGGARTQEALNGPPALPLLTVQCASGLIADTRSHVA